MVKLYAEAPVLSPIEWSLVTGGVTDPISPTVVTQSLNQSEPILVSDVTHTVVARLVHPAVAAPHTLPVPHLVLGAVHVTVAILVFPCLRLSMILGRD